MENMEGLKNKKILVTGGGGFIGSHLVLELVKKGAKVFVVDIEIKSKSFFSTNKLSEKTLLKVLDIRDKDKVFDYFDKFNFDYVFHLAAEALVPESYSNPYAAFETNIMGTVNILEAARRKNETKGIIVASSDKAYGKTKKAYTESMPLRGDHPYDVSKAAQDLIAQSYIKTYKLPIVVTRFGNVYGEGDLNFGRIIPDICKAIIRKETLLLRSDGTYVRDYIYVKDVVAGYIFLLNSLEKIKGESFNFSSRDNLSVIELIELSEKVLKVKINYDILNNSQNEILYQHLDDRKIRRLGWRSRHAIIDSLPKVYSWYKELL